MITTNIQVEIGLELPIGCITTSADKLDGPYLIPEREKLMELVEQLLDNLDNLAKLVLKP